MNYNRHIQRISKITLYIIDNIERDFTDTLDMSIVVHLDPVITNDPILNDMKSKVSKIIKDISSKLDIHDFRMVKGVTHNNLIFDVVVPPEYKISNKDIREHISSKVKNINEDYFCVITIDRSYIKFIQPDDIAADKIN